MSPGRSGAISVAVRGAGSVSSVAVAVAAAAAAGAGAAAVAAAAGAGGGGGAGGAMSGKRAATNPSSLRLSARPGLQAVDDIAMELVVVIVVIVAMSVLLVMGVVSEWKRREVEDGRGRGGRVLLYLPWLATHGPTCHELVFDGDSRLEGGHAVLPAAESVNRPCLLVPVLGAAP